jgi:GNAT superfamily N-acetyltransferase
MIEISVRNTRREDVPEVVELGRHVYPRMPLWREEQILSHLSVFPEGQLVAVAEGEIVGMAASLIVTWDDYDFDQSWRDFTAGGMFTNHDPGGRTLYGAEVMVHPGRQRMGIGRLLYAARRQIVDDLDLARIRAGARIPGYREVADRMSPEEYVERVVAGEIRDPTLSFQLSEGFRVIAVVEDYLEADRASLGHAVIIEWVRK